MTSIFLAGAENPTHQQLLIESGADRVAVNVASLLRRKNSWELDLPMPGWEWVAYADEPVQPDDLSLIMSLATKPPVAVIGPETWLMVDDYLPIWNGEQELPEGASEGLVVTDRVFKDKTMTRRALSTRTLGTRLGVLTGSIDPGIGRFDFVVSPGWWSVMKFGETQVWDGRKMWRYSATNQDEVRSKHREDIEALGIDPEQIMAGEADELARLAIVSWKAYAASLDRSNVVVPIRAGSEASMDVPSDPEESGSVATAVDNHPANGRHRTVIPVMGMSTVSSSYRAGDGTEVIEEQAVLIPVSESVRKCDNCFLAQSGCPGFAPGQPCAYTLPVEIRSKDQLQALLSSVIEIQTQRVLMARFAEEIQGQELGADVGREMDRLFGLVEKSKDIMDNRDTLKLTMEAKAGNGVLSRLFGEKVGTNARMLQQPVDSNDIIEAVIEE